MHISRFYEETFEKIQYAIALILKPFNSKTIKINRFSRLNTRILYLN